MQKDNIEITYKNVKESNLKVKPSGEAILTVPTNMTDKEIDSILARRAEWIKKQREYFQQYRAMEKEYVSGESATYLGRNYRLKIIESNEENVKMSGGYLQVFVKNKNDFSRKKRLIDEWYKQKAREHFYKAIKKYSNIVGREVKTIRIRQMKTRWGSCNPNKSFINLNLELIKKSTLEIEYVVFHELAHLVHHNHNSSFYNYLTIHMPDWRRRKERLEYKRL